MKLKLKLAIEAVENRDLIKDENRQLFGDGFLAGFAKARGMALLESTRFNDVAHNHGSSLTLQARLAELGEEEVPFKPKHS